MPKSTAITKGDALEEAVRAIEGAILRGAPGYREGVFKVQGKRIVVHDGVRHEIDVYVTASLAAGYESVFVFECKNWEAKVGKNEVIILAEKIAITGAQRGFLVAKAFTRDARAQAKKDLRVELLLASHYQPITRVQFPQICLVNATSVHAEILIAGFASKGKRKPIDYRGKYFVVNGTSRPANEFINELVIHAKDAHFSKTLPHLLGEGSHRIAFVETFEYESGTVIFEGKAIRTIHIDGVADTEVVIASVISVYEVNTRGRMILVGASSHGLSLEAHVVQVGAARDRSDDT